MMIVFGMLPTYSSEQDNLPVLSRSASSLSSDDSTYLCGRRASVEVFLGRESAGRSAFAPLDAFNQLDVGITPEPRLKSVTVQPGKVTKNYAIQSGGELIATWHVDRLLPLLRVSYQIKAGSEATSLRFNAGLTSNLGYINKFVQHDDDVCKIVANQLRFSDNAHPDFTLDMCWSDPRSVPSVTRENHGQILLDLQVQKGRTRIVHLQVAASSSPIEVAKALSAKHLTDYAQALNNEFQFNCPDKDLNEFVRACTLVPVQNVRDLPFGPPYSVDGLTNKTWPVITASPDYHGIFANDCIQSMWELGLLGPQLYKPSQNSIETMLHFGSLESVEWWTGNGQVWQFPIPLGNTPQVALGACWHLLWSGNRSLAEKWWPAISRLLALHDKWDADGDELEDRPNTPYPEQPDPGKFNHEMLYVQCFWRQAFHKASQVAEWLCKPEAAALELKSQRISKAIERVFGTSYGLAVWVDKNHHPHPHIGHEQIIAAAAGDVSEERSKLIVHTAMSAPIWTPDGPLRAEPGKGVAAGDHVWTFMRWKLVQALFRLDQTDTAQSIAHRWAIQERDLNYQAPEAFPTVTGTTGKLYTWTAGRSIRGVVIGLSGLELTGHDVQFSPKLPSSWPYYSVKGIPLHGATIDLVVRRGKKQILVDGQSSNSPSIPYDQLEHRYHVIEVWLNSPTSQR